MIVWWYKINVAAWRSRYSVACDSMVRSEIWNISHS